jgi:hypothetical protein
LPQGAWPKEGHGFVLWQPRNRTLAATANRAYRLAICRRTGDSRDADAAGRACHVLDDNRLTERHSHAVGYDAPDRIH